MGLGITVNDLRNTKKGGITDPKIARKLIGYAINYNQTDVILKIQPDLVRDALIAHIEKQR